MSEKIGFVILDGRKIFIRVKDGKTSKLVFPRWVGGQEGGHLPTIERALRKKSGALRNLTNGRMVAL